MEGVGSQQRKSNTENYEYNTNKERNVETFQRDFGFWPPFLRPAWVSTAGTVFGVNSSPLFSYGWISKCNHIRGGWRKIRWIIQHLIQHKSLYRLKIWQKKKIARGHRITVGSASKMVPGFRFNIFFTDNYFSLERIDQIFSQNLFHLLINWFRWMIGVRYAVLYLKCHVKNKNGGRKKKIQTEFHGIFIRLELFGNSPRNLNSPTLILIFSLLKSLLLTFWLKLQL